MTGQRFEQRTIDDESQPIKGRLFVERAAPWRDTPLPPYSFMLSVARNLQAEAERAA